jgi:hypothetical protein
LRDTTFILAFQSYNALAAASRRGHALSSTEGQAARWRGANQSASSLAAAALRREPRRGRGARCSAAATVAAHA